MSSTQQSGHEINTALATGSAAQQVGKDWTAYLPLLFVLSLLLPYRLQIGPLLLSPYRLFLLLALIPCFMTLASGRIGRLRAVDYFMFAHSFWMAMALLIAHGFKEGVEPAGVHVVEVMGSYLVARCYIRSARTFYSIVRIFFISIVIMLPFTMAESITGQHYLNKFFSLFGPTTYTPEIEPRMGFARAFGVFEHPIHLGIYGVSLFSLTYYVLGFGSPMITAGLRTGFVAGITATSMSSGPLLTMVVQVLFMAWDHLTRPIRQRWWIFGGLAAAVYVLVDIISNRTPFHVIVSYLAFNTGNAYNRILIWDYGTAEVTRHPLFGIGLGDWQRPEWMSSSMDNFWLVLAVQGGLPAFLFFAGAVSILCIGIGKLRLRNRRLISYRRGWVIAILALAIGGGTVHYWKAMMCLLVFLIGSAVWMLDEEKRKTGEERPLRSPRNRVAPNPIQLG